MIVKVTKDCRSGNCMRYTIGKPGDAVSGALYIADGHITPDSFSFIFPETEKEEVENVTKR